MAIGKSIRIYDLAREVKQDTKRVMEDLRREGADVSVASNSVPFEIAEKVRSKYFPKTETAPKRAIKVIKAAKVEHTSPSDEIHETVEPISADVQVEAPVSIAEPVTTEKAAPPVAGPSSVKKLSKKVVPEPEAVVAEEIPAVEVPEAVAPTPSAPIIRRVAKPKAVEEAVAEPTVEDTTDVVENVEAEAEVPVVADVAAEPVVGPGGTTVKRLTLSPDALKKGIKPGDRLVSNAPTKTGSLLTPTRGPDGRQLRGTPGENAAPQMTYTPPADNRRRPGRSGGRKGNDKGARFAERDVDAPQKRSIEERVLGQVGAVDLQNLRAVRLTEGATIREFAEALGVTPRDIVQLLIKKGVFATLNQPIGEKMAKEMAAGFGFDVSFVPFEDMVIEQEFEELIAADADDVELSRAPVITVMGHVDHGKTSLLDAIRSANVAGGEAGGITQHIGAYSVLVPNSDDPKNPRRVVFLDTPGHEAFTMMRARGAKATDIIILVVAADDGVMPQTIEAVDHSKAAGVPIIVAINKIDRPDANPDKVKQGLAGLGLQPTDWGGETEMVAVSAKTRDGLDTLLETVLLQADILDLKASPTRRASGVVLEAKLDKGRGAVATALVQQ